MARIVSIFPMTQSSPAKRIASQEIFYNHSKIVSIPKSLYICRWLFGEKSERLKAICACIRLINLENLGNGYKMRVSQSILYSTSFSVDAYRLGKRIYFISEAFQSPSIRIGANKFPSLLMRKTVKHTELLTCKNKSSKNINLWS